MTATAQTGRLAAIRLLARLLLALEVAPVLAAWQGPITLLAVVAEVLSALEALRLVQQRVHRRVVDRLGLQVRRA